jgi:2-polyprenyl-6-methoxyphenol hydroxylase-like FAD-dependent oxidoreductase
MMPRTLEIFDMAGLVDPFLEVANRVNKVAVIAHGNKLAGMSFTPDGRPYPFVAMVPQDMTESLLVEALRRKGGTVEYETRFVGAVEREGYVGATLECKGEWREVTAAFVVGCDGAHSKVRHLLNLPFEGAPYDASFILADVDTNDSLPGDELQLCPSEFGPLAIFPMNGTRRRIVATVETREEDTPSLDTVRKVLLERGPENVEARALRWSSYFRVHHRHVDRLQIGRMFIAGDAAHIHSPIGGQGMNTGLHDAWNLAWKLDLVLHGGGEQLLDSYTAERLPVIKHVIDITHFMTKAMATPSRLAQAVRNRMIPIVSRLAPFQHFFVQQLSLLGVSYFGSPMVEGSGERFFDDSLRGGNGINRRFLLLIGGDVDSSNVEAARQLCEPLSRIVELRNGHRSGITLVRPDGYIACRAHSRDATDGIAEVRSVLERQSK